MYVDFWNKNLESVQVPQDRLDNQWLGASVSAVADSGDVKGMIIVSSVGNADCNPSTDHNPLSINYYMPFKRSVEIAIINNK
jgi:hypothetical protein